MVYAFTQDVPIDEATVRTDHRRRWATSRWTGCSSTCACADPTAACATSTCGSPSSSAPGPSSERIHPAVDATFGGARPPVEPTTVPLEVIDAGGALVRARV